MELFSVGPEPLDSHDFRSGRLVHACLGRRKGSEARAFKLSMPFGSSP